MTTETTYEGHTYRAEPNGEIGIHTGRTRRRVVCVTCGGVLVHPSTTSVDPRYWHRNHFDDDGNVLSVEP